MYKLSFILLCFILPNLSFAQKNKKVNYTFSNLSTIEVDGYLTEWGDALHTAYGDLFRFGVNEHNGELVVAIEVEDEQLLHEVFRSGFFINISYDDKKKDGARFYFPYWDRERKRALINNEELVPENIADEFLNNVNGYYVMGFGKVRDGLLTLDNDYNIRAEVKYIDKKMLRYEARIPLDLVGVKSNKIAVQVGVSTQFMLMKKAQQNSNVRNNTSYYQFMRGRPMVQNTLKNPFKGDTDVWIIDEFKK
ncbi:hypothetical protein [Sphingobacterium bovistauri]|uniref:Uncharacterized protein n=1 Tax=Sphingobacterium bovistauri TaxID=2781959 RepID=A0ABS7Z6R6_9SPHI|nr:hypothetical protein [Sphingobacterium bovistauri]MCA5005881.1 hypothetical protein [Sphingobacterium bovistauri]